ncbi:MAG: alpha-D-ribose 1-methylphosphonate 5-triphosphate diphosphatase [Desulfosoma sp.]
MRTRLYGGPLFDGERLYDRGRIVFDHTGVLEVHGVDGPSQGTVSVDVRGGLILPGLVDLHSDVLEKCIEMRPGVLFEPDFALTTLDRRLAASGITTFCHAISFADNELGLRSPDRAEALVRLIKAFDASGHSSVRHCVHGRFEVGSDKAREIFERLLLEGLLDMVSIMDHTPGQGQFRSFEAFHRYYSGTYKLSPDETASMAAAKVRKRDQAWRDVGRIAEAASRCRTPLLSHDDDSREKVGFVHDLGACGSEFPVTAEAAREAKDRAMAVLVGAPNVVRGASSNSHLSAREAVSMGLTDALVSDYYPECLLQAPFVLHRLCATPLDLCLAHVTSGPAGLLSRTVPCGFLKPGYPADVAVVEVHGPWARVTRLWVAGRLVYEAGPKGTELQRFHSFAPNKKNSADKECSSCV